MRLIPYFLLFFLSSSFLHADALSMRLRLVVPGDEPAVVNERQFLYQKIDRLFREWVDDDRIERRGIGRQIKIIHDRIKRKYLKKYDPNAKLSALFRDGSYNDVSFTIIVSLALERFNIPYDIHVDHWACYTIADPGGREELLIIKEQVDLDETQKKGFRKEYFSLMRHTQEDEMPALSNLAVDSIFFKHYYEPSETLSFGQLCAYVQYRYGLSAYAEQDYDQSVRFFNQALKREERPVFILFRRAAELQISLQEQPELEGEISLIFKQWNEDPENQYLAAAVLQHFDDRQQLQMAENRVQDANSMLEEYLEDAPRDRSQWSKQMRLLQEYRLLDHYFRKGKFDLARKIAEDLYQKNKDNYTLQYILAELVINDLRKAVTSNEEFRQRMLKAVEKYPFIRTQDRYADLLLREQAWKVRNFYEADQPENGYKALQEFREALIDIPIGRERNLWTLTAFLAASNYHFRQGEYALARDYVDLALRYGPDDSYLIHRKDLLLRY